MFIVFRYSDNGVCFASDGIAQITTIDFAQVHIILLESLAQEAVQYLIGIAKSHVDISTGMSAS